MKLTSVTPVRKPGICYAQTVNGQELPVIDLTNPAFFFAPPSDTEMATVIQKDAAEQERFNRRPAFLRKPILWYLSRRSKLMRGVMSAHGTFLTGMNTYLMKLGPNNLGKGFNQLDRLLASSIPAISLRHRMQEIVRLMTESVAPLLAAHPGRDFQLINIAGGPSLDSINVLIRLHCDHPRLLPGRLIRIHVLDLESAGPVFGGRALLALMAPHEPLAGLDITLDYTPYHWDEPQRLQTCLESLKLRDSIVVASSEGGLFDYGTDSQIIGHLEIIRAMTPHHTVVAATTTPTGGPGRAFNQTSGTRTISRTRDAFGELVASAGWVVSEVAGVMMNDVSVLKKSA